MTPRCRPQLAPWLLLLALGANGAALAQSIDLTRALSLPPITLPGLGDVSLERLVGDDYAGCFRAPEGDALANPLACLPPEAAGRAPTDQPGTAVVGLDHGRVDVVFSGDEYALDLPWAVSVFMPPVVHLTHDAAYQACVAEVAARPGAQLADCSRRWQVATPAAPVANQQLFNDAVEAAWQTFQTRMIDDLHAALNRLPSCMTPPGLNCVSMIFGVPPVCPVPDMACVTARLVEEYPRAFVRHYPAMWEGITRAMLEHLPNSVAYGLTANPVDPLEGSFVAPIYTPVPDVDLTLENLGIPFTLEQLSDPEFLLGLGGDARRELYYNEPFLALLGIDLQVAALPGERQHGAPGLLPLEQAKVDLGVATAMAYEFRGYTVLNQLYTDRRTHWFFETTWSAPFFRPALEVRCTFPPIPTPLGIPIPVPGFLGVPTLDEISVPEGYLIPRTAGDTLWTPRP